MDGAMVSVMVTKKVQVSEFPDGSSITNSLTVIPIGKVPPLATQMSEL